MTTGLNKPWIPLDRIDGFIRLEPALLILALVIGAWLTYRFFLREISDDRKDTLDHLFKNLFYHLIFASTLFFGYWSTQYFSSTPEGERFVIYLGIANLFFGTGVFVKVCRILVFEYFYLSHMKVQFPVLLVNLFTLLMSMVLAVWIGTEIFNIRLAPLLATSAVFSLVLGLALQDTLGNLFSGVALQIDKPYEIGEWIEVQGPNQKWVGKVEEITWRATVLMGHGNEIITIPNRIMGQSQIANYASRIKPIQRLQILRLPFHVDIEKTKQILQKTLESIPDVKQYPPPGIFVMDTNESGIAFKLLYCIVNFGEQFIIADKILSLSIQNLVANGYEFGSHRVEMTQHQPK